MVYTITFNPAIDYVVEVDNINPGHVNRCKDEYILFGGKGINVSTVLNNLGIESVALGFIAGFTGDAIEKGVQELGVKTDFIRLAKGQSRINVKIKSEEETDINARGPKIEEDELERLYTRLDLIGEGDMLVLAGSVPDTLPSDIYMRIMERVKDNKTDVIVDATKELLLNVLEYRPFLVKPNKEELGELFHVSCGSESEVIECAWRLRRLGARNVLVSMGGDGALLLAENNELLKAKAPSGDVVSAVGAGDSMVAGFIAGYMKEHDYRKALNMGTAAGSATAFSRGLAIKEKVDEMLEQIE